jgi:hypothetical protein
MQTAGYEVAIIGAGIHGASAVHHRSMKRQGAALFTALLMLAACAGTDGSDRPSPSADRPSPSEQKPMNTPDLGNPPCCQNEGLVTVTGEVLVLRSDLSRSATPVPNDHGAFGPGDFVELQPGDHMFAMGLMKASGGLWWLGVAVDRPQLSLVPLTIGWVEAGTVAAPRVKGADVEFCPGPEPTLTQLLSLTPLELYWCTQGAAITFEAYPWTVPDDAGLGGACVPASTTPSWLYCDNINYNFVNRDGGTTAELRLHFDPATGVEPPTPGSGQLLRITGHFGDESSVLCAAEAGPDATSLEGSALTVACLGRFVVESIEAATS